MQMRSQRDMRTMLSKAALTLVLVSVIVQVEFLTSLSRPLLLSLGQNPHQVSLMEYSQNYYINIKETTNSILIIIQFIGQKRICLPAEEQFAY